MLGIGLSTFSIKLQVIDESNSILVESSFPLDVSILQTSLV